MQVRALALMTALLLLLTACSSGTAAEDAAREITEQFSGAEKISAVAVIRADYGGRVHEFRVKYEGGAGAGTVTVLSPEEISGLTAHVSVSGCTLAYGDAELDTGNLTPDGMSPLESLPTVLGQWQSGSTMWVSGEKYGEADAVAVATRITDDISQCTWFDRDTLLPLRSELSEDGYMIISCDFENVVIE